MAVRIKRRNVAFVQDRRAPPKQARASGVWDHYTKLKRIGSGSYGTVYRARRTENGEKGPTVVVKMYMPTRDGDLAQDAVREIAVLRLLCPHPNVPVVHEIGVMPRNGRVYAVMDDAGESLYDAFVSFNHCPNVPQLRRIAVRLLAAIAHCHEQGVLHRDVKPDNVCVSEVDGRPLPSPDELAPVAGRKGPLPPRGARPEQVRLLDMGLSRAGDLRGRLSLSVCTSTFRPPEIARAASADLESLEYGPSVDVWSCGCTLFELATAMPLFSGDSDEGVVRSICVRLGLPYGNGGRTLVGQERDRLAAYVGRHLPKPTEDPTWTERARREFTDLLRYVLRPNPGERPGARDVLRHPFLSPDAPAAEPPHPRAARAPGPRDPFVDPAALSALEGPCDGQPNPLRRMLETANDLGSPLNTVYIAARIFYAYLSTRGAPSSFTRLDLAMSCLLLAAKINEMDIPSVRDLRDAMPAAVRAHCGRTSIVEAERAVAFAVDWRLYHIPNTLAMLRDSNALRDLPADARDEALALYVLQLVHPNETGAASIGMYDAAERAVAVARQPTSARAETSDELGMIWREVSASRAGRSLIALARRNAKRCH